MDRREIVREVVDWIHLAPDRDQWWTLMNAVRTFDFRKRREISWLAEWLSASEKELRPLQLDRLYAPWTDFLLCPADTFECCI
jgi:hypothetical protein